MGCQKISVLANLHCFRYVTDHHQYFGNLVFWVLDGAGHQANRIFFAQGVGEEAWLGQFAAFPYPFRRGLSAEFIAGKSCQEFVYSLTAGQRTRFMGQALGNGIQVLDYSLSVSDNQCFT